MSDTFHDSAPNEFLVQTSFVFGGREFLVDVGHDGVSYWFDPFAKDQALKADPNLIGMAMLVDDHERKFLAEVQREWTVQADIPDLDLIVIRDELSPRYWSDAGFSAEDSRRLDGILEPIFWSSVNPQLSVPIESPKP